MSEIVHEDHYFVIQRKFNTGPDFPDRWVGVSANLYGDAGLDAALPEADRLSDVHGEDNIRIVRRDITTAEEVVQR